MYFSIILDQTDFFSTVIFNILFVEDLVKGDTNSVDLLPLVG